MTSRGQVSAGAAPRENPSSGIALIIVLWTLLGLTATVLVLVYGQAAQYREVEGRRATAQARLAAESAIDLVGHVLSTTPPAGRSVAPDALREPIAIGEATVWLIGRSAEGLLETEPTLGWVPESAKLDLNAATVAQLSALPGMSDDRAEPIVAWRRPAADGAAAEGKGGPFESVEELRLLDGLDDDDLLYAGDENRNGAADGFETGTGAGAPIGLADGVTVNLREPNVRADGSPRVNVNGPREALETYLAQELGDARGRALAGGIRALGTGLRSPLEAAKRAGFTAEEFARVEDGLTADDAPMLPGRVNVNAAPAAVLAALPGLDDGTAERLAARRAQNAEPGTTIAWVMDVLDAEECAAAGPHLTAQSHQVSADAAALGPRGRGYARIRAVFDTSDGTVRRVYRQELSHLGDAMGRDARLAAREVP